MNTSFIAKILIRDGNPYIAISDERARQIKVGWRKPMPVILQINGKPDKGWKINMVPNGTGGYYLYLHGAVRKASSTKVGDRVEVSVAFDDSYKPGPMHLIPDWFKTALEKNAAAKAAWDALIPSRKKEMLRYFAGLKSDQTRTRNLTKALEVLGGKAGRFMARDWKGGK